MLVLLRDQTPELSDLLQTVSSLYATIPALVRLVVDLWPEQVLRPSTGTGRMPLHMTPLAGPLERLGRGKTTRLRPGAA